jgi:hypothetical protein
MRLLKHLVDPANVMPILRTMPAISNGSDSRELPCAVTFHKFPWGSTRPRVIRATAGELRAFHRMSAIARISNAAGCVVQPPFIAKGVHGIEACAEAALGNFNLDLVRVVAIDLSGCARLCVGSSEIGRQWPCASRVNEGAGYNHTKLQESISRKWKLGHRAVRIRIGGSDLGHYGLERRLDIGDLPVTHRREPSGRQRGRPARLF